MDRAKIEEIQALIHQNLCSYTTAKLQTEGGECKHFELTLSFRKNQELDSGIRKLQKLNR